jgi:hypothetical protein
MSRRPSRRSASTPNGTHSIAYAITSTTAIALTCSGLCVNCSTYSGISTPHAASPMFEIP